MATRRIFWLLVAVCVFASSSVVLFSTQAFAAKSTPHISEPVIARLISVEDGVLPGARQLTAGLHLRLKGQWHTYWRSPGEVGLPPKINWDKSQNIADLSFEYPEPTRFEAFGIQNFGYAKETLFPLQISLQNPNRPAKLVTDIELLVCEAVCVPETFSLALDLPLTTLRDQQSAALISKFIEKIPQSRADPIQTHLDLDQNLLLVGLPKDITANDTDVFPELGFSAFGPPSFRQDRENRLWASFELFSYEPDGQELAITVTSAGDSFAFETHQTAQRPAQAALFETTRDTSLLRLLMFVGLGLLGGFILNFMPCVLPVISIKLAGILQSGGHSPRQTRRSMLATSAGILTFMLLLAVGLIVAKQLGNSVGWGLHFQNASFLTFILLVLMLFAANLFGAFEFNLPEAWSRRLDKSATGPHLAGDYATGLFTALLATPCSAPFLGTAVAFALSGNAFEIILIFSALGIGLSFPYLVMATFPSVLKFLPRPGPWLGYVKPVLGLLVAVTAIWIATILLRIEGAMVLISALLAGFAIIAMVIFGRPTQPPIRVGLTGLIGVLALLLPLFLGNPVSDAKTLQSGVQWQEFSREAIAQEVSQGQVVFLDITADWCLTCRANKKLVLEREAIVDRLNAQNIVPMQADWTRPNPEISSFLKTHNRFGIPFNIVYGPQAPKGIILPEILTTEAVNASIAQAGRP